jgi:hypothetical protein
MTGNENAHQLLEENLFIATIHCDSIISIYGINKSFGCQLEVFGCGVWTTCNQNPQVAN